MAGIALGGSGGSGVTPPTLTTPAVAGDALLNKEFINGSNEKVTGTISSKGAATYTPGASAQTIAAGQYLSGVQTIAAIPRTYKRVYVADINLSASGNLRTYTIPNIGFTPTQLYLTMRSGYSYSLLSPYTRLASLMFAGTYKFMVDFETDGDFGVWASGIGDNTVKFNAGSIAIDLTETDSSIYFCNCVYRAVCIE